LADSTAPLAIFTFFCCCKQLIMLARDAVDRPKTAVVPTKGIFLAGDL
jgi:hypothetical protein